MSIAGNLLAQLDESFSSIERAFTSAGFKKDTSTKTFIEFSHSNGKKVKVNKEGRDGIPQSGPSAGKTVKYYLMYLDGKEYGDINLSSAYETANRLAK